jgi:hypothetical protein
VLHRLIADGFLVRTANESFMALPTFQQTVAAGAGIKTKVERLPSTSRTHEHW